MDWAFESIVRAFKETTVIVTETYGDFGPRPHNEY